MKFQMKGARRTERGFGVKAMQRREEKALHSRWTAQWQELEGMTVKELQVMAKEREVKGRSGMVKGELIRAIVRNA